MQRRKFVVGLGSLAAGASVTMGTGALSQSNLDRGITGNVVGDGSGYLQIDTANGDTPHPAYAKIDSNGEITVAFEQNTLGDGVNPDSENWFDDVFRIDNADNGEDLNLWFTKNGSNADRYGFYVDGTKDLSQLTSSNPGSLDAGAHKKVGVYLDATDMTSSDDLDDFFDADDEFTIHVSDTS